MSAAPDPVPHTPRVVVVAPMPPEKSAYALARYSRSPDSVRQSLEWVKSHSAAKFLESFYFQYGHASIADLGHCIFCFEGVSELAAIEIEDEQLWDGQAKSSRYQDFSKGSVIVPPGLTAAERQTFDEASGDLMDRYRSLHAELTEFLKIRIPQPAEMKDGQYRRTIEARAYDGARYLLFLGISTNLGQVTSIRTLEGQMRRLGASEYGEISDLAREMKTACGEPPACVWDEAQDPEPLAPTLAKYAEPDEYRKAAHRRMKAWAADNVAYPTTADLPDVDLVRPTDPLDEIAASWLYSATSAPFRVILDDVSGWSVARKREILDVALEGREVREELLREFRSGYAYVFDIVCDIGGYRDMHRHRRCQQIRQEFTGVHGFETPELIVDAGLAERYAGDMQAAAQARMVLPERAGHYLLPFATRCRSLFKMDFAEAEYISRVRSGVKGHISYRKVAWEMRERILEREPHLGELIHATSPDIEDPLTR